MISVLYVDDEPDLLEIGKLFLEQSEDLHVDTMTSARAALVTLGKVPYDAIISDYQMPEMDGLSFLKEVRAQYADIPFILFTGRGREEVVIEAINNGADFYLQKGGEPASQFLELSHKIRQAVRRRSAEQALAGSRAYLDQVLSSVQAGILVIDATTHRILDVNPTAADLIGLEKGQILGTECQTYIPPAVPGGEPVAAPDPAGDESETILLTADKRAVPIIRHVTRVELSGRPCILATFIDNTRRKQTEQELRVACGELTRNQEEIQAAYAELAAKEQVLTHDYAALIQSERNLRESEEQYRTVFESANDAIVLIRDMKVVHCNRRTLSIFGCTDTSEIIGHSAFEFSPEYQPDGTCSAEQIAAYTRAGPGSLMRSFEWVHLRRDGTSFYSEVSLNTVEIGGIPYLQSIVRDISDRKHAEQAAALASRKLYMMNEFSRHEITNTITGMTGLLDMTYTMQAGAERDQLNREMMGLVRTIQKQIAFTKEYQEVGVREPRWQQVQGMIPGCSRLELAIRPSLDSLEIYADPLVGKIFSYLAENVVRHGGNATLIEVFAEQQGHNLRIVFEDNGVGVPEAMKATIFERRIGESKGMGLFLVREILAITGIVIAETGTPGTGARFEIVVPEGAYRRGKNGKAAPTESVQDSGIPTESADRS
jgi:PAS domain S-box-containing protein